MKRLFVLFILYSSLYNLSFASAIGGYDAGAVNTQYMRDLRTHEAMVRAKNKSAIVNTAAEKAKQAEQSDIVLSDIKSLVFVNNNSISSSELQFVAGEYINKPMTAQNVTAIRKAVMKYYQQQGYFSALAMVVSQNTQTGELVIEIKEGGKNSITIE